MTRKLALAAACIALFGAGVAIAAPRWLADPEGARALRWAARESAPALERLYADPAYGPLLRAALDADAARVTLAASGGDRAFALEQSVAAPRGSWRASPLAAYRAGRPQWETLIDFDAMAAAEKTPWRFEGAVCRADDRCMVRLGEDESLRPRWREFDLATKSFIAGGFDTRRVSAVAWSGEHALWALHGGDLKLWTRGVALEAAPVRLAGATSLVAFRDMDGSDAVFARAGSGWSRLDGPAPATLPIPADATLEALHKGELLFRIGRSWTPPGAATAFPAGALVSLTIDKAHEAPAPVRLAHAAAEGEALESVAATRDAAFLLLRRDEGDKIARLSFDGRDWFEQPVATPSRRTLTFAPTDPEGGHLFALASSAEGRTELLSFEPRRSGPRTLAQTAGARVVAALPSGARLVGREGCGDGPTIVIEGAAPAALDGAWLATCGKAALVPRATAEALIATAEALKAQNAGPIGLLGGDAAAHALARRPDLFAASVLRDPTIPADAFGDAKVRVLVLGLARPEAARALAHDLDGREVSYVEAARLRDGGSLEARARRQTLEFLYLRKALTP